MTMLRAGCVSRPNVLKCLNLNGVCYNLIRGYRQLTASSSSLVSPPFWELKKDRFSDVQTWRFIHREIHAVRALLIRSGLGDTSPSMFLSFNGKRGFHTSQNRQQNEDRDKKDSNKESQDRVRLGLQIIAFSVLVYFVIFILTGVKRGVLSWNDFVHNMLAKGEVREIIVDPEANLISVYPHRGAIFRDKPAMRVYSLRVDADEFYSMLREAEEELGIKPEDSVPVKFRRFTPPHIFTGFLLSLLIFGFIMLMRKTNGQSSIFDSLMQKTTKANFTLVSVSGGRGVKFSDIAGLKEAKQEVMEFVDYLKHPERYCQLGAKVPKGALLLGPPGCGKTLLAKAVATESNVPFLSMNGSEFSDIIGGVGAARVRDLFKEASKKAPCIIYIDEIDAVGRKRSGSGVNLGGDADQTLNQLLVELDGIAGREGVITLASTNRSDVLDQALMRPGRFDRQILIDVPTAEERKEIFEQHLKSIKFEEPPTFYSRHLAQLTPGFTGADIANICNEAALHAARLKKKNAQQSDLEYAVDKVLYGAERKTHSFSVPSRQQAAIYHAGRVLVGWFLEHTDALLKVSILSRTKYNLGTTQFNRSERYLMSNDELYDLMAMNLGGKAAEDLIFSRTSILGEEDLKKVTNMAYNVVEIFGMNETVGMLSLKREPYMKRFYSRKLHAMIDLEARKLLAKSYDTARTILKEHEDKLTLIARELLKKEALSYDDICGLIGPPPHGHKKQVTGIDFEVQDNNENSYPDDPPSKQESSLDDKSKTGIEIVQF